MAGTILQQSFVVEYIVNHQMCDDCRRVEAKDTWNASVSFTIEYLLFVQSMILRQPFEIPTIGTFYEVVVKFVFRGKKNWFLFLSEIVEAK